MGTLKPSTLKPDTPKPDTLKPDTLKPDTLKPDTLKPDSLVTVKFDGLFLFTLDHEHENVPCQAKLCTAAEHHQMEIKVIQGGTTVRYPSDPTIFYSIGNLKSYGSLCLRIEGQGTSIVDDGSYDQILKMTDLYPEARIKETSYQSAFFIHNGKIGAGDLSSGCRQVKLSVFQDVPFSISEGDWQNEIADRKTLHPNSITDEEKLFAKNVRLRIDLQAGQKLRLIRNDNSSDLISPIIGVQGENCDINIFYVDVHTPENLADCMGIGHHSEALRPEPTPGSASFADDVDLVTWTFFRPKRDEETTGGCCEAVCLPLS